MDSVTVSRRTASAGAASGARTLSRRRVLAALAGTAVGALVGCAQEPRPAPGNGPGGAAAPASGSTGVGSPSPTPASVAEIVARATVPVVCYHQVRPWRASDSAYARSTLICPPDRFSSQLDGLAAAGFTTISAAQYQAHMTIGAPLPAKPVMLTFDDGKDNQATTALPELARRGMTGTLFVMTVVLDKPGWMSSDQVRAIVDLGMTIGSHTWDHHRLSKLPDSDWAAQLDKPRETLRRLSGQDVDALAYPYGSWSPRVLPHVVAAGYSSAYQLTDQALDASQPLLTLRRRLAASGWTGAGVVEAVTQISASPTPRA